MVIVNFAHPFTDSQLGQLEALLDQQPATIHQVACHFDHTQPFTNQIASLVDEVGLSAEAWQTMPILVNPPSYAPATAALMAELHGRMGHFPSLIRIRPVAGSNPTQFEVAEVMNLQATRDATRTGR
jgi:hypothetical protein